MAMPLDKVARLGAGPQSDGRPGGGLVGTHMNEVVGTAMRKRDGLQTQQ